MRSELEIGLIWSITNSNLLSNEKSILTITNHMWPYVSLGSRFPMWSLCLLSLQRIQLVFRLMEEIVHSLLPGNQVCHIFFQINESHYYQFASITSMPQCSHHHNTIGFYDMQLNNNANRFVKYEGLKNENGSYYSENVGCVILGPLCFQTFTYPNVIRH